MDSNEWCLTCIIFAIENVNFCQEDCRFWLNCFTGNSCHVYHRLILVGLILLHGKCGMLGVF